MVRSALPFDRNVARWEQYTASLKGRLRQSLILAQLQRHLPAGRGQLRILDAGCGLGELASALLPQARKMVLLDFSAPMLAEAKRRLAATHTTAALESLELVAGPIEEMAGNLADGSFDLILCHNALEYAEDPATVLGLLVARLAPAGVLSLVTANRYSDAIKLALGKLDLVAARKALAKQSSNAELFDRTAKHTFSPAQLGAMVQGLGLSLVGRYGVRAFADYLPEKIAQAPENEAPLFELEQAVGQLEECHALARYSHLICQKEAPGTARR